MQKKTKEKIKKIVGDYCFNNPTELYYFEQGMRAKRKNLKTKFAETGMDFATRALYEVPETLFNDLFNTLSPDEMGELNTKVGGRWFANSFPEFKVAEKNVKI